MVLRRDMRYVKYLMTQPEAGDRELMKRYVRTLQTIRDTMDDMNGRETP